MFKLKPQTLFIYRDHPLIPSFVRGLTGEILVPTQMPVVEVRSIRGSIQNFLGRAIKEIKKKGPDLACEILADGIRQSPIPPLFSKRIAAYIEKRFGKGKKDEDFMQDQQYLQYNIDYILGLLTKMQQSDGSFQEVMEKKLDYKFEELKSDLKALYSSEEAPKKQTNIPELGIIRPSLELHYPCEDNKLKMILRNKGGGTICVEEIYLDIEKFEPAVDVDYSMPAAPLELLLLEVQLSVDEDNYPLLDLNNQSERYFSARRDDAEKVEISISSKHNAKYWIRLRLTSFDLETGQQKEPVYYPELNKEAIVLSYNYAPGWTRDIKPEDLLARPEIYDNIANKLKQVLLVLQDCHDLGIKNNEEIHKKLDKIGIQLVWPQSFFQTFLAQLFSIAILEKNQDMLPTVLKLIMYYDAVLRGGEYPCDPLYIEMDQLVKLTGNMQLRPVLEKYVSASFSEKQQLYKEILSEIKTIS